MRVLMRTKTSMKMKKGKKERERVLGWLVVLAGKEKLRESPRKGQWDKEKMVGKVQQAMGVEKRGKKWRVEQQQQERSDQSGKRRFGKMDRRCLQVRQTVEQTAVRLDKVSMVQDAEKRGK
jgi:hypothetical protein